ncbi:MAG: 30S ribosomal protein S9 [bacterium]|nr:30S ribosomal protein S9 [bacterium]
MPKKKELEEKIAEEKVAVDIPLEMEEQISNGKGKDRYYEGVGRRKTAVAIVRLFTKKREIIVNDRDYKIYFPLVRQQKILESPFEKMKCPGKFGATIKTSGGGIQAQAEAIRLGISRAMVEFNLDFKKRLRRAGFLTRDSRMVERKKYGFKKARKSPQWSKR